MLKQKKSLTKRFVGFLLIASMTLGNSGVLALANELSLDSSKMEVSILNESVSEDYLKYVELLDGDYNNIELTAKFKELFGDYSDEYVRENYAEIFDLKEGEQIDEAFLDVITNYEEDFSLQKPQLMTRGLNLNQNYYFDDIPKDEEDFPEHVEEEEPVVDYSEYEIKYIEEEQIDLEINEDDEEFIYDIENEVVQELLEDETVQDDLIQESIIETGLVKNQLKGISAVTNNSIMSAATATSDGNSFTSVSLSSKTNTSVTLSIWFKTGDDVNNYLKMYDCGNQAWTTYLGQGQATATSRTYTISGLIAGNVYKFKVGKYDKATSTWQTAEIKVQTNGAKTPSLQVVSTTSTSITLKAQFPAEGIWGNRLRFYNKTTQAWQDISGSDNLTSGTYTISNLVPGMRYQIYLRSYNDILETWNADVDLYAETDVPSENLISYSKSNIDFKLDKMFSDVLGTSLTNSFLNNTNQGYTTMYNLVNGNLTYSGGKMQIEHVRTLPSPTEGRSGWPITWQLYRAGGTGLVSIDHALTMKEFNVSTTETPFHEISHNFDNYEWVFEAEALAILKIYYHYSVTGQSMVTAGDERFFAGKDYKLYMKSYANRKLGHINYDEAMANNVYSPYSLAYNLGNIADSIGWDKFTQTFTYFYGLPSGEVPTTKLGKFNLFLTKLSDYSGQDVFSMFTAKEKSIYQTYFGGTIKPDMRLSAEEVYAIAQHYISESNGYSYQIIEERVPLVDETGNLFAYAVPFTDGSGTRVGHINVGALKNGLSFYLIDPYVNNYTNIKKYSSWGWDILYAIPFAYYYVQASSLAAQTRTLSVQSGLETQTGDLPIQIGFTSDPNYFNDDNYQSNMKLLEQIIPSSSNSIQTMAVYAAPTVAQLQSEANGGYYVNVFDGTDIYYGGDQDWWSGKYNSRTEETGDYLAARGCGVVAFTNIILYNVYKDYNTYEDLLKYTNNSKSWSSVYDHTVFNKKIGYITANNTVMKDDYLELLDFYADLTSNPKVWGVNGSDMLTAYKLLDQYTEYNYTVSSPSNKYKNTVESFLINQLNNDTPIMFLNYLEANYDGTPVDTQYLLNDPAQANTLKLRKDADFDNHWMTITKYYKDNNTGKSFVAFSTWGKRISINSKLLMYDDLSERYYSDFYAYNIYHD